MRAIERLLVADYEAAIAELAGKLHVTQRSAEVSDELGPCIEATRRLRRFLSDGEIPEDVHSRIVLEQSANQ